MTRLLTTALLLTAMNPGNLSAEETLSPKDFEQFSQGMTLTFSQHGEAYGVEQYFSDHSSIWSYDDGTCVRGEWFVERDLICFTYENRPAPQCWSFHSGARGFSARIEGGKPEDDLVVTSRSAAPIACKGPDVGV